MRGPPIMARGRMIDRREVRVCGLPANRLGPTATMELTL